MKPPNTGSRLAGRAHGAARYVVVCGLVLVAACQTTPTSGSKAERGKLPHSKPLVRQIPCLYEQRPWLNLDAGGDRDPEGVSFRAFLDPGTGRGTLVDGTFHIELYVIEREPDGQLKRTLASDWHYPTKEISTIDSRILGKGYLLLLRWANKKIAGREIEIITQFEDKNGNAVRAPTKRLRVPKYES